MKIVYIPLILLITSTCLLAKQKDVPQPAQQIEQIKQNDPINPPAPQSQYKLKRKIAVARFSNETRQANSFLTAGSDIKSHLSKQATDMLTTKLVMTGNFIVVERQDTLSYLNEQRVSNIERMQIPADFMIVGSITEFGRKVTGDVGLLDRKKTQTAFAKVSLRLLNTKTGVIVYGEEGYGEANSQTASVLGMGSQAGYDETLTDKAIDTAITSVIQNLLNKLYDQSWKSYILSNENGLLYISGGEKQGIKVGDVFKIMKSGKMVNNPQTNMPIELPATKVGSCKVTNLIPGDDLSELSECQLMEGDLGNADLKTLFISE
jgi:curli biogenesis system outer membrane secretion channel CsgG